MNYHIPVPSERSGMELDEFLCLSFPLLNKGYVRRCIREGRVLVDGSPAAVPSQHLHEDQVLFFDLPEEDRPQPPVAPSAVIEVLYEDDRLLVVNKPPDLAVEPERWRRDAPSLAGALLELARERTRQARGDDVRQRDIEQAPDPEQTLDLRLRLVHRIDKDTSGVVLVAKDLEGERRLRGAFEHGEIQKDYLALVEGEYPEPEEEWDLIDLPLGPDERRSGRRQVVSSGGAASRTQVRVERRYWGYSLLRCRPLTGRTHQIRVHLSQRGFPLVVDPLYGRRKALFLSEFKRDYRAKRGQPETPLIERLTLHAWRLCFPDLRSLDSSSQPGGSPDPAGGEAARRRVEAPIPRDFERVLKQMGKVRPPRD